MPAGMPYFAWIDPGEITFEEAHKRWDENVFSFTLEQNEGDPASLTVVVRRPRNLAGDPVGLLGPGRKIWAWFALDCDDDDLVKFRGRLVGVPTSLFEDLVTLEFVARPIDLLVQKEALAQTLRVPPYYDEVVLDPARRSDPEVVLEGYTAVWHYDRETHDLTISDEIIGEDGLVVFDGASEDGKIFWDGLGLSLASGPLARVELTAEFTWTQQATGQVDLTDYLVSNWPNEPEYDPPAVITSFTFTADNWPKQGTGIGTGWMAAQATADAVHDLAVKTDVSGGNVSATFSDGAKISVQSQMSKQYLSMEPPGSIKYPAILTKYESHSTYARSGSVNSTSVPAILPLHYTRPTLVAGYTAARQCTELVRLSLMADVQHILTDPEDGEVLRIDDIRSVNLSERLVGAGTDGGTEGYIPVGDPRRRSYIGTARGEESLQHLIALARAHLMKRARVVEITIAPKLKRMSEITLRKNAMVIDPRIGEAQGKVISYSLALDGEDGTMTCMVRIGCAIGRGGSAVASGGEPTYCSEDYAGADYQQYTGRVVLFDSSVGYAVPAISPNDDGINFLSTLRAEDVIDRDLQVDNPPATQRTHIGTVGVSWDMPFAVTVPDAIFAVGDDPVKKRQELLTARADSVNNALQEVQTRATFKLKSMNRAFSSDYDLVATDLKIPTGYNLEAV